MERNARTRTLIQLGGILVKSGLVDHVGIPLGADLQNNADHQAKAYELLNILENHFKREMKSVLTKKIETIVI